MSQVDDRSSRLADVQASRGGEPKVENNEGSGPKTSLELQITKTPRPKLGFKFRGSRNADSSGGANQDLCRVVSGHRLDKQQASKNMEVDLSDVKGESKGDRAIVHGLSVDRGEKSLVVAAYGCTDDGSNSSNDVGMSGRRLNEVNAEVERMEMVGGGGISASL